MGDLTFLANSGLPSSENGPALKTPHPFTHSYRSISPGGVEGEGCPGERGLPSGTRAGAWFALTFLSGRR